MADDQCAMHCVAQSLSSHEAARIPRRRGRPGSGLSHRHGVCALDQVRRMQPPIAMPVLHISASSGCEGARYRTSSSGTERRKLPMRRCVAEVVGTAFAIWLGQSTVANELLAHTKGHGMGFGWLSFGEAPSQQSLRISTVMPDLQNCVTQCSCVHLKSGAETA